MVLSLHIAIYMSFFVFNKFCGCKTPIETETDLLATNVKLSMLIDESQTMKWHGNQVSNLTRRDCCPGSKFRVDDGGGSGSGGGGPANLYRVTTTAAENKFAKHSADGKWRNVTGSSTTTAKPNAQKPNGFGTGKTTQRPKVMDAKWAKSLRNVTSQKSRNTTAVWPKPGKRLSGGGARKPLPPPTKLKPMPPSPTTVKTTTNHTDEGIVMTDFKTMYPVDLWKDHGFYTDDYMKLINAHWFTFTPPNAASHYVLGFLYTVIMVFGCFGNSLVIFMYIKCKSLQTPANVLIMNLAVSDFIMLAKTPVFIYNSYYQGPALGKLGCQIYGFFGGLTGTVSIMTLAAISLDRYYVIVHPLNAAVKTSKQRARVWIGLIWTYGFSFSAVPALDVGYNRYVPEGYLTSCSFDYLTDAGPEKWFIVAFFAAAWCVPFTAISYCYVRILRAVWATGEMAASRFGQEEEKRKTEVRLGYVVVGVIALWFVSWTPYAVVALLGVFGRKHLITPLGSMVPALFCKAASCMDPWIYAITHPRFKRELAKLVFRKKARKLERDYGVRKGWSHSNNCRDDGGGGGGTRDGGTRFGNQSSTEDEDVEEVIVQMMVDPNDDGKMRRHGSTYSHKTDETRALETKFPPTRQESLKYMPPSWYKMPRTSSKSSIKSDAAARSCIATSDNPTTITATTTATTAAINTAATTAINTTTTTTTTTNK